MIFILLQYSSDTLQEYLQNDSNLSQELNSGSTQLHEDLRTVDTGTHLYILDIYVVITLLLLMHMLCTGMYH